MTVSDIFEHLNLQLNIEIPNIIYLSTYILYIFYMYYWFIIQYVAKNL